MKARGMARTVLLNLFPIAAYFIRYYFHTSIYYIENMLENSSHLLT